MRENIIKKTLQSENKFNFEYRREFKFNFKKRGLKFRRFGLLSISHLSMRFILKFNRCIKHNYLRIKEKLLLNKYIYFNYITNGLNLKYDELKIQNLNDKNILILNYNVKNSFIVCNGSTDIIKTQKFLYFIENCFIGVGCGYIDSNPLDYFNINLILFYKILIEFYSISYINLINKLIYYCF